MVKENLSKKVDEIVEKANDLLSRIDEMTDESIETEFREIWRMMRELIFDINYEAPDLDKSTKREYVKEIVEKGIELSQKILERMTDKRFREYIINVFVDWLIFEAIHRWDIELPKIEIPEPPVTKTELLRSYGPTEKLYSPLFRAEPYNLLYSGSLQSLLKELIAKVEKLEAIKPSVGVIEPPVKVPISYQRQEKECTTLYKIKEKTTEKEIELFYSSFGEVVNT